MPCLSLTGGYLASRVDKTLVRTGDLASLAPKRLAETANWWVDVTTPGGLDRFSLGFTGTLRVRIMHAHVRAAMHRLPDWNYDAWDHPVNQVQVAGTLTVFSLGLITGCQALGLRFTRKDRQAVYHLWRYVGWLLGTDPQLLPVNEIDTWRLFWLEAATELLPDDDSHRLVQAQLAAHGPVILALLVVAFLTFEPSFGVCAKMSRRQGASVLRGRYRRPEARLQTDDAGDVRTSQGAPGRSEQLMIACPFAGLDQ